MTENIKSDRDSSTFGSINFETVPLPLFELSSDAMVILDDQHKIVRANPSFQELFGYSQTETKRRMIDDLIVPDHLRIEAFDLTESVGAGGRIDIESIRQDKNRRLIDVSIRAESFQFDDDETLIFAIYKDISARKDAERELFKSREREKNLLDNIPLGIYRSLPVEGHFLSANPAVARMFGCDSVDEFLTMRAVDLYQNPKDRKILTRLLAEHGQVMDLELKLKRKDGSPFLASVSVRAIKGVNDDIEFYDGVIEDITDRKLLEDEKKSAEEWLRIIFEYAPDAIYVHDIKGVFMDGNRAAERLLGYKREELIGKSFKDVNLRPLSESPRALWNRTTKTARGKPTGPEEFTLLHKEGAEISVEISSFPVKIGGERASLGIARDISGRKKNELILKESEAKFRAQSEFLDTIIDAIPYPLYVIDVETYEVVLFNAAARDVFTEGYTKCYELTHARSTPCSEEHTCPLIDVLKTGESVCVEHIHQYKNGKEQYVEVTTTPLFDQNGKITKVIEQSIDITIRRELEEQKIRTRNLESVGRLAAATAHEFNNLLTSIGGNAGLLEANFQRINGIPEKVFRHLNAIFQSIEKSTLLINRLNDAGGNWLLRPQLLDFNEPVSALKRRISTDIPGEIDLTVVPSGEPVWINADPDQLNRMVDGLVTYACSRIPAGGSMKAELSMLEPSDILANDRGLSLEPGRYARLSVHETGQQLTQDELDQIFDINIVSRTVGEGLGYILPGVLGAARQNGGELSVCADPEGGNIYDLYYPLTKE